MTVNRYRRARPPLRWVPVAVLAAALLAGCARAGQDEGDRAVPTPTSSSPTGGPVPTDQPGSSAAPGGTSAPSLQPRPSGKSKPSGFTVRGRVAVGVEPRCLILNAERGGVYQLVGGDRSVLRPGQRVEVTGTLDPNMITTCQQGTPLKVSAATAVQP